MRKPRQLKKNAYYHVSNGEHMKYANGVFPIGNTERKQQISQTRSSNHERQNQKIPVGVNPRSSGKI